MTRCRHLCYGDLTLIYSLCCSNFILWDDATKHCMHLRYTGRTEDSLWSSNAAAFLLLKNMQMSDKNLQVGE